MKLTYMKTISLGVAGVFIAALVFTVPMASTAAANEVQSSMARGGKLYDKWFKVIGAKKPKATHKAWPSSNSKKKGDVTWRCKSCHGWDGKGKDGAYAKGSYKTGIKGVNGMWGADTAKIVAVIKDKTHGFGNKMSDEDYTDLANFISKGMIDMDKYIDLASKSVKGGDKDRGAAYFNTICANCHREDGTKPKDMGKSLASQLGNPWEVMHKIFNGQPDEKMPALRAFGMEPVLDIMAHIATLPKKKLK